MGVIGDIADVLPGVDGPADAAKKLREDEARRYNEYLTSLGANKDQVKQAMDDAGFSFFDPSTQSGSSTSAGSYAKSGFRNEDSTQRYVAHDKAKDTALLNALMERAFAPSLLDSGYLGRALGEKNRAYIGNQAAVRNQAARRGLGPIGQITGTMADQARVGDLAGTFRDAEAESERRRVANLGELGRQLQIRAGQNNTLRARYGERGTDTRSGTFANQSFSPGNAAMNALNFENAGLAPTASPLTGQAAPWMQGLSNVGDAGAQALMSGLIPMPWGGSASATPPPGTGMIS